jgi:hypothetical protein
LIESSHDWTVLVIKEHRFQREREIREIPRKKGEKKSNPPSVTAAAGNKTAMATTNPLNTRFNPPFES